MDFFFFCCGAATQRGSWPPHSRGFLDHTQRRTTVGRTSLDEWSARRRDLYLTTPNTLNRQISMPPVGFEPTISAGERSQTYALDRAATGTGLNGKLPVEFSKHIFGEHSSIESPVSAFSGSRVVPCGRTDRHDEANSRLLQFCYRA